MNVTLSVSGALEEAIKGHKEIKWTEIARKAMGEEAERLRKVDLLMKYLDKKPISRQEWEWMGKADWHPVDEMKYKPEFVKSTLKAFRGKTRKVKSVSELLK